MAEMDDIWKLGLVVILICAASAVALWDPRSLLDGGTSPIRIDTEDNVAVGLNVTILDWGWLEPGQNKSMGLLVTNTGNVIAFLNITTLNWNPPEAAQFLSLTWDLGYAALNVGNNVAATLTLHVSPMVKNITNFSFEILINAVKE
jgi:hypothetical protein